MSRQAEEREQIKCRFEDNDDYAMGDDDSGGFDHDEKKLSRAAP